MIEGLCIIFMFTDVFVSLIVNKRLDEWVLEDRMDQTKVFFPKKVQPSRPTSPGILTTLSIFSTILFMMNLKYIFTMHEFTETKLN